MNEDYEIRTREPSEITISYGETEPIYIVWDLKANKLLPFAVYRRHDQAVARIIRERARD